MGGEHAGRHAQAPPAAGARGQPAGRPPARRAGHARHGSVRAARPPTHPWMDRLVARRRPARADVRQRPGARTRPGHRAPSVRARRAAARRPPAAVPVRGPLARLGAAQIPGCASARPVVIPGGTETLMRIVPLHAQLLIRPVLQGDITRTGLLIPSIARGNAPYRFGDVVEAGPGRVNAQGTLVPLTCKPGDVVAYAKGAGLDIPIEIDDGEEMLVLLDERYVLGIVHDYRRPTSIMGADGRLLDMAPASRARPDIV